MEKNKYYIAYWLYDTNHNHLTLFKYIDITKFGYYSLYLYTQIDYGYTWPDFTTEYRNWDLRSGDGLEIIFYELTDSEVLRHILMEVI